MENFPFARQVLPAGFLPRPGEEILRIVGAALRPSGPQAPPRASGSRGTGNRSIRPPGASVNLLRQPNHPVVVGV